MPRGPTARVVLVAVVCLLVIGETRGEEGRDLRDASREDLIRILRTERPTPELTEAVRSSRRRRLLEYVLRAAVDGATGAELVNAVEHVLGLGMLSTAVAGSLSFLLDAHVAVEGTLRRIYHPDLHVYTVVMDVDRVLRGSIPLGPADAPLRVLVSAFGCHRRWILIDWEPGTRVVAFATRGEVVFESRRLRVPGWTAYGTHVWKAAGREEAVLAALAPLALRDPAALIEGMRSEDPTRRWLSAVRTVLACHALGEPFSGWWRGSRHDLRLDRAHLEPVREQVVAALEAVEDVLVWNEHRERFERGEREGEITEETVARLRERIRVLEQGSVPSVGTPRLEVEHRFGEGRAARPDKLASEAAPDSAHRTYAFPVPGLDRAPVLWVTYDADGKVQRAHFLDPYAVKGRMPHESVPLREQHAEARHRLRQMQHIRADLRRRYFD